MTGLDMRYRERLVVSWWLWPCVLALATLMAAEIHLGYGGLRSWLPYAALLPLTAALLGWLSRVQIRVSADELLVDDARIPLSFLAEAHALDAGATRRALGRELHPFAFVVRRPWVRTAVRIVLDDPADPTPYWLVSTRRPAALIDALGLPNTRADFPRDGESAAAEGGSAAGR